MKRPASSPAEPLISKRPHTASPRPGSLPPVHSGAFDKWELGFKSQGRQGREVVAKNVIAAAETIRANFSDLSTEEDAASLWLAIKILNMPQLRPWGEDMEEVTGVALKQLVDAEARVCHKAEWKFGFIMFDHM